jgi:glucokinase
MAVNVRRILDDAQTILAVDVGGTFTRAVLMRGAESVEGKSVVQTPHGGAQLLCRRVIELKEELEREAGLSVHGIAVALGCIVEPRSGIVEKSLKLGFETRINLQEIFRDVTGLPAVVRSELSMAALGETVGGGRGGGSSLVVLTVGTGLGAGIVIQGRLYFGATGCAGEIGHIPVVHSPTARPCSCGRRGCLESYAASRSVTRIVGAGPWGTPEEAVREAQGGGREAMSALGRTGRYIALAAAICVNTYDPELVILRGGFVRAIWPLISDEVHRAFADLSLRPETVIRLSHLDEDAVFLGLQAEWVDSIKLDSEVGGGRGGE